MNAVITHDPIELQLAHSKRNAASASYNHTLYLEPRTPMMQDWADYLEAIKNGSVILKLDYDRVKIIQP